MKQIEKTPKITERLKSILGADGNVENLAVYEVVPLNTRPLRQKHPIYEGAVADLGLLSAMADEVKKDPRPLQIMHDKSVLPTGKVFDGGIVQNGDVTELRSLIYVPKDDTTTIAKLESAVVDEVSVSILPKHILCSECGWDYLGADATFDNIFNYTCGNGHVLRENGVHARMTGLDSWNELSLVGRGGAVGAKILPADKARLMADGASLLHVLTLNATPTRKETPMTEKTPVELTELVNQLVDAKSKLGTAETKVTELTAQLTTLTAKVTELTAALDVANKTDAAKVKEDLTKVQAELKAAVDFLKDFAKQALVASGQPADKLPETVAELIASIGGSRTKLLATMPQPGGHGRDASTSDEGNTGKPVASLGAFRTHSK